MKTTYKISPVNIAERQKIDIHAGDTVKVAQKIQEKGKTRLQMFEGLVLAVKHGKEAGSTFTVRKTASGVGVERIFPLYSPMIDKITITKRAKVRRANKEIRRQMRNVQFVEADEDVAEIPAESVKETPTEKQKVEA